MSIWDSVKKFAQPYADDDYDDYDEDDEYLDEDYEGWTSARVICEIRESLRRFECE